MTVLSAAPVDDSMAREIAPRSEVVVSGATNEQEWDEFVMARPEASGYHLWRWRHVFEQAFDHETVYLIARRGGEAVGILPLVVFRTWLFGRFAVSLPFVNYGGVVADDADAADALLARAAAIARERGLQHVELRHQSRRFTELPCRQHKVAMILPLASSVDEMWARLDRKVRNQVRKAEKSDLVVECGGKELVPAFYRVFAHNMRDLGTPVYTRRLFEEVLRGHPGRSQVFCVKQQTTTIAAAIAYRHGDTVEVPWASSLAEYRGLCPNNALYWCVIKWAIGEGVSRLDFGRSSPGGGTYQFKMQWGARPHPLHWEYVLLGRDAVPDLGPGNSRFTAAIGAWKRLPLWLANQLGPVIVRNIP